MIADFEVTEQMLRHFIQKVHQNRWAHPRVVVCVPSGVTGVEKRAVEEATLSAGARQAYLIEEPMAAAIGAGLPVAEPTGNMIVDIGGGTTEVAVISLGGIVVSQSVRVGGDELDEAIVNYVKREYKVLIGTQTAEEVKLEIGSAATMEEELQAEIRGRDLVTGLPKTVMLSSQEVRLGLDEPLQQIIDAIKSTLDKTPPELSSDIMDRGIVLAGGGALLHRLDERLRRETEMPVHVAESPLTCVAVGSGRALEEFDAAPARKPRPGASNAAAIRARTMQARRAAAWREATAPNVLNASADGHALRERARARGSRPPSSPRPARSPARRARAPDRPRRRGRPGRGRREAPRHRRTSIATSVASTRMRPSASAQWTPRAKVAKPMSISSSVSRAKASATTPRAPRWLDAVASSSRQKAASQVEATRTSPGSKRVDRLDRAAVPLAVILGHVRPRRRSARSPPRPRGACR